LIAAGEAYCQLDKPRLNELIAALEPKVRQLASVLSLNIKDTGDYTQILIQAHEQMSRVAESVAATLSQGLATEAATAIESEPHELHALALARQLRASFEDFFSRPSASRTPGESAAAAPDASVLEDANNAYVPLLAESRERRRRPLAEQDDLTIRLTLAVGECRSRRRPLGVVLLAAHAAEAMTAAEQQRVEHLLETCCDQWLDESCESIERPGEARRVLILPNHDRAEAVNMARRVVERLRRSIGQMQQAGLLRGCVTAAGVASVASPAKNFRPVSLLETAERCLSAALGAGGVKSLEVS
jgi:hypothetical protein